MTKPHAGHALGRAGEERAAQYFASKGYRILDRNVRAGGVELDLVAARAGTLIVVEVKTRRSLRAGAPHEAVDARKQTRLRRGGAAWLREDGRRFRRVRFDVVSCVVRGEAWELTHWPGAF